ncbi:putative chitinase [Phytophthora sojae]|uniref:Chitinase n=1 Tax=Phytophthora sojae (strain P6497) TaxID=1094619 RepID=G4YGX1_PHYSP|nr:putative chitinase [Phytophthora sojae]EGZ27452.1 putative chitinase [Phytophthora sojae]|eukprot:XP_009514727.1 putative chitinase [Phytophthora sojae]
MKFAGVIASVGLMAVAAAGTCKHSRFTSPPSMRPAPSEADSLSSSSSGTSAKIPGSDSSSGSESFSASESGSSSASGSSISASTSSSSSGTNSTAAPSSTSGSSSLSGFARFFDQERFRSMFPDAVSLYNFGGLVNAASKYTAFANTGNDDNDKRELAAFLAQTAHESDSFKAAEEYAWNTYSVWQYCDSSVITCAPGSRYHGRGPIQLSWNYNYDQAGKALGLDLLNNPDIVASNTDVAWMTALWYWMTPQGSHSIHDVVADTNGFAQATKIINGALECGPSAPNKASEQHRIEYYTKMCETLHVQPLGSSSCNA